MGSGEYASVGSATNAAITGSQTFFIAVKVTAYNTTNSSYLRVGDATNYVQFRTAQAASDNSRFGISFEVSGVSATINTQRNVVELIGKWVFAIGVYDASAGRIKVFMNGAKVSDTAITGSHTAGDATIRINASSTAGDTLKAQNVGILSVALSDNQAIKLTEATIYSKLKIRRATTDAYIYQDLPVDLVRKLRGKTLTVGGEFYQAVASTGQISIDDGTEEASSTTTTTGAWAEASATKIISATATQIRIKIKHSTTDGATWFKKIRLHEGPILLAYAHSAFDWSRFPSLLRLNIPSVFSAYQYEEGRKFAYTPNYNGFSVNPTAVFQFSIQGKYVFVYITVTGTSNSATFDFSLPALPAVINTGGVDPRLIIVHDNGSWQNNPGVIGIVDSTFLAKVGKTISTIAGNAYAGFTSSGAKGVASGFGYFMH